MKEGDIVYYVSHAYTGGLRWAIKVFKGEITLREKEGEKVFVEIIEPIYGSFFSIKKGANVHATEGENLFSSLDKAIDKTKSLIFEYVFSPRTERFDPHNLDKLIKTMNKARK